MEKQFVVRQIQKVYRHDGLKPTGKWVIEEKSIAHRREEQTASIYHDMAVGEIRMITEGFEIVRVQ